MLCGDKDYDQARYCQQKRGLTQYAYRQRSIGIGVAIWAGAGRSDKSFACRADNFVRLLASVISG